MINWKDPQKEMPPSGSHIWVCLHFPNETQLLSTHIFGVEVHEKVNKEQYFVNHDWLSKGKVKLSITDIVAWVEKESINLPERV